MSERVEQIVDLIRAEHPRRVGAFAISTAEAMHLIELYGNAVASDAAAKASREAWDKALSHLPQATAGVPHD